MDATAQYHLWLPYAGYPRYYARPGVSSRDVWAPIVVSCIATRLYAVVSLCIPTCWVPLAVHRCAYVGIVLHVHRTSPRQGSGRRPLLHDPVAANLCPWRDHPHPPPMQSPHGPHPPLEISAYGRLGKPSTTGWRGCIVACSRMPVR